jgi:hypothetical protein
VTRTKRCTPWLLCALVMGLVPDSLRAEVEFFFNTSPSDPPKLITRIVQNFPLSSVGHGTMYVSSACRDHGAWDNKIRPCTDADPHHGLVISFDVDLQKNTNYYFLAVSRDEFFYGNLDPSNLPQRITRPIIDRMDAHFYEQFPLLHSEAYFRRHVEKLSEETKQPYDALASVLVELSHAGITDENLDRALSEHGIVLDEYERPVRGKVESAAAYFEKNGISPQGMSRRVVTWAVRFYQGVWGLVYPTSAEEERELIEYVNSLSTEEANILSVNCVMPMDVVGEALTVKQDPKAGAATSSPRYVYVPYFVMKRLVKGAFEADVGDVNEFGEFIRRPGTYMKFYPQVEIAFDKDVPRAPKTVFQKGELVGFYESYQSQYANYLDWVIETLLADGVAESSGTVQALREVRRLAYAEETRINKLERDYEGSAKRDPAVAAQIERDRQALLEAFDDEMMRIMGVKRPGLGEPGREDSRG